MRLVLSSFQGSRAILELHYGENRHARLELDQLEDRYFGQRTEERAREELSDFVAALRAWLEDTDSRIEGA
jgi:uncharacterized protein YjiS (DUF1127 family)